MFDPEGALLGAVLGGGVVAVYYLFTRGVRWLWRRLLTPRPPGAADQDQAEN
jgi:hypothetical protein